MVTPAFQRDYYLTSAREVCQEFTLPLSIDPNQPICPNCSRNSNPVCSNKTASRFIVPYDPYYWPNASIQSSESSPQPAYDSRYTLRLRRDMLKKRMMQRGR